MCNKKIKWYENHGLGLIWLLYLKKGRVTFKWTFTLEPLCWSELLIPIGKVWERKERKNHSAFVCHLNVRTLHSVDSTFKWFVLVSSLSWTFRIESLHHWNLRACYDCCISLVAVIQVNRLLIRSTFRILSFKQDLMVVNVNGFAWRLLTSKLACW